MDAEGVFQIELLQQADYRFEVHFDAPVPVLITDEGAPVGADAGPSPAQLLGTAVANCLAASLLFAMRKFRNEPGPMRVIATVRMSRNEHKRLRISRIAVDLYLAIAGSEVKMLDRILSQFEDFCIVTQSVRSSIPVDVTVLDKTGTALNNVPGSGPATA
jgi:uncharacterized OsmC-like protein